MLPNNNRKKQPIGATSNIFAVAQSHTQRQDHKHYKSLYTFNPNDLAEYSLPVVSDPKKIAGKGKKVASGVVNSTKLAPVHGQVEKLAQQNIDGTEEYDMDGNRIVEDQDEDMENEQMQEEEYDDEEEKEDLRNQTEDDFTYEEFKHMIEKQEEGNKNDVAEQRRANFIKKGTAIWHIQQGIKTGEHAISFFAKHGNNMPIKFVNCNRKKVKLSEFRPYDLETVQNDKDLDTEYFTISAQGVVQVYESSEERRYGDDLNNRTPTEFLSLSDWMGQSTMFNVLTSMKFFKYYLIGKVFGLWKGNVRYRTYNRTRLNLSKQLIQFRPDFLPKFLEINKILSEMQSKLTFELNKGGKNQFDLSDFVESQKTHRDTVKGFYNEKVEDIITKNLVPLLKEIDQSRSLKEEEDMESTKMGQAAKNKSMVLIKEENFLKNQVLRLAKRNYNSLGTFIRLIDYSVVETQVSINLESAKMIFEEMKSDSSNNKKTQISTQLELSHDGLNYTPDKQNFYQNFEKILQDMQNVTEEVQRVITHQDLLPLVTGLITDSGPKFNQIVEQSFEYKTKTREIVETLQDDFEALEGLSKKWEEARPIFEFENNNAQDREEFYKNTKDVASIKIQLDKLVSWQDTLEKGYKKQEIKGIINMNASKMKERLFSCLKTEHVALRQHAFEQGKNLGEYIQKTYKKLEEDLGRQYNDLAGYVSFMQDLSRAREMQVKLEQDQKMLEQIKQLLSAPKYRVKDEPGIATSQNLSSNAQQSKLNQQLEQITEQAQELYNWISKASQNAMQDKEYYNEDLVSKMTAQSAEVEKYVEDVNKDELLDEATEKSYALQELEKIQRKFAKTNNEIQKYRDYERILEKEPMPVEIVKIFEKKYQVRYQLWNDRTEFEKLKRKWYGESFKEQDAEQIIEEVKKFNVRTNRLKMNEFGKDEKDDVLEALSREIQSVRDHTRLIQALGNRAMVEKHWNKIFDLLNQPKSGNIVTGITLNSLLSYFADQQVEAIEVISGQATGEKNLQETIKKVEENWEKTEFFLANYRDSKDRFILKQVEDIIVLLEDDSMVVGTCMGSKYVTEMREQVEDWEQKLGYMGFLIDDWINFQRQWMYLENIFNAPDIQAQLKAETKKFQLVDKFWKDHMLKVKKQPRVLDSWEANGSLLKKFQENNTKLDEVQKALEDYLETKKAAFPRFYFLTNDELLEILSQTRNAHAVQPFLSKCFDNIKKIEFSPEKNSTEILGMWSSEFEYVAFSDSVQAVGAVEDWLGKIETMMKQSLYDLTQKALLEYPADGTQRDKWLFDYPAQPVLTVDMIIWTAGVSHAITEIQQGRETTALQSFMDFSEKQLRSMVRLVRTKLNPLQRSMMGALIVLDVHNKTVVENMMKTKVDNINHFDWTKQLRYYWEPLNDKDGDPYKGDNTDSDVFCKQTNTRFRYGYEYLGNGPRLVITPLTDKCYMTLTGALHLYFGGNPQGPAGTGKTETTKDLAKAMAIQCIVFNCSDGLDARQMARFFVGLASGGAWSCFDEFNRINIEVLSVIGTQILTIQSAVRERREKFEFEGQIVPLNFRFGVFITMNPGYAGRTELPDNLKALFRPISMMIPDYRLIAEIILYSEGFDGAQRLSKKMTKLYSLSSEQLSKQDHYDFGMRAVKSVLVMAGQLKRKDVDGKEDENILLIRAMRDSNVPKFLTQDLGLFYGIIQDLFPGIDVPLIDYGKVQKAIENKLRSDKLQIKPTFITKIIQLFETMQVRHGNMVVGSTGTGKSTIIKTLGAALTQLKNDGEKDPWFREVKINVLNPKAVTMGELFGEVNKFSNEWTEGIVSCLIQKIVEAVEDEKLGQQKRWVLFDGPVDALWIENMNTVLDDSKMLCLNNGQRIRMPETATMLFEVNDLKVASPATVSRCGMVFLEPVHLGWEPLLESWYEKSIDKIIEPYLTDIKRILSEVITKMLGVIRKQCREIVQSVDINLVNSCLNLCSIFLNKEVIKLDDTEKIQNPKKVVLTYIAFSIIWSLGANIHDSKRSQFSQSFYLEIQKYFPEFPDIGDVYELGIDSEKHELRSWSEQIPIFEYNPKIEFFDILVPTNDTTKFKYLLTLLMQNNKNALLIGETGVGKSVITKEFLMTIDERFVSTFVNFSGKTTTKNLSDAIEGNLARKRKNLLAPEKSGKKMIFFIDDINMPQLDRYFSQPPVELLRQTIDSGGFYDIRGKEKDVFKYVQDCLFIAGCAPPGGGRNPVTPRLFRHFNMIWIPDLSQQSMRTIFTSILKGYLSLKGESGLQMFADQIIKAAVEIYQKTKDEFLPTPTKSHYTFNLRDLSKIVQGMLMCENQQIEDKEYLVKLYMHETFRVFRDRLIVEDDKIKFNEMSHQILENNLNLDWQLKDFQDVLFGDFEDNKRVYIKMSPAADLVDRLNMHLQNYNTENAEMNLVFFDDCIAHLARIARILRQQRGNAMLVGVGGSGRSSMARLASFLVEGMKTFQIEITKSYKDKDFQEDIKNLLRKAGLEEDPQLFLFNDSQIVSENFLEDINNLLNSGEIPNLFPKDEKEAICDEISDKADKAGSGTDRPSQYAYFIQQCRQKLHLVLTFSPVGNKFRERCRQFPSIINCCTIDWYLPWPEEALNTVAQRQFTQVGEELQIKDQVEVLAKATCNLHKTVKATSELFYEELRRRSYTTPTSYLDLCKTFIELLRKQQAIIPAQISKYEAGLTRLAETNVIVERLKNELIQMIPEIERREKETQESVVNLEKQTEIANQQEKVTDAEAKASQKIFNEVSEIEKDCKQELSKALPALDKATKALDVLKPADIGEMARYNTPNVDIALLISGVQFLLGEKGGWPEAQTMMSKPAVFIERLKGFDKDNVKEKTLKGLKKFTQDPKLEPKNIKTKSAAGESIAIWMFAMDTYAEVKKVVVPKEKSLGEAKAKLAIVEKELNEKKAALDKVRREINRLNSNYKEQQLQLEKLTQKKENNELQLKRAKKLVEGLANESKRWEISIEYLIKDKANMVGNIVLAAGYISYVGCFTAKYRNSLLQNWQKFLTEQKLKFSPDFTVQKILGDPILIRDWNIKGLPADNISIENGIIAVKSKRWPLLIDPQSQGNKWIKNMERENGLQVIKLSNAKFIVTVETAIRNGQPVILENIEETLDPQLEPVLNRNIIRSGGQDMIKLGSEMVPYSKDFKFFITTKLSNPHYLPEICIKVTLINFTVTPEGLEDQLLVEVVKYEQPELEQKKDELVVQLAEFKRQLKDIEAKILKLVAEASEDILNDEELILTLDASKQTSTTIGERMEEAERIALDIARDRENYRCVAVRGSVLYFVVADLANINFMYQYSLEFFIKLLLIRLEKSKQSENLDERLAILIDDITQSVYVNICRGLFEVDKLLFSFMNTSGIFRRSGEITVDEWNFFLRGSITDFRKNLNKLDFIDEQTWYGLLGLEETHANFKDLSKSFQDPGEKMTWKQIMKDENPEKIPLPAIFAEKLSAFQHLMLIKVLRKTKLIYSIKQFVSNTLGVNYIQSPPMKLDEVLADSIPSTPIIFVLSPGADPIAYLMALAAEKGMKDKLRTISLGQGQDGIATRLIEEGSKTGLWICFQNCHLFTSWMGEFEKLLEKQDPTMLHNDYRLWLTSDPSASFPVPILQSGIKLTLEPPRGLKANMTRTFQDIGQKRYEEACDKGREYRKLVFALAYFHSAILERRKYGAIGWNVSYQWMNSDFNCSEQQLMMYLNEQPEVPYQALNYLVALVNYGGRVTDDKDCRLIEAMLKKFFTPEIMADNYKLSKLPTYYAPPDGSYDATVKYIKSLPLDEDPEVFGLHSNANITFETNLVNQFLDTILSVQPRVKGKGNQKTPEEIVRGMAIEMYENLAKDLDKSKSHHETFAVNEQGAINSLGIFAGQEIDRFNVLVGIIRNQLKMLDQAIQGFVVMSEDLEKVFNSFTNSKTPERWLDTTVGYPCLKPLGSWYNDFNERFKFMADWITNGPPVSYWIPAFFFPQGFMTATLQTFARKNMFPIDNLAFRCNVMPFFRKDVQAAPEVGVNIHGLFMQGAKWDYNKKTVEDSDPKIPMINFPVIWIEPIEDTQYTLDKKYQCPLYKTSLRAGELNTTGQSTNFVLYIDLPTEQHADYWIRRGTALLCMQDD